MIEQVNDEGRNFIQVSKVLKTKNQINLNARFSLMVFKRFLNVALKKLNCNGMHFVFVLGLFQNYDSSQYSPVNHF